MHDFNAQKNFNFTLNDHLYKEKIKNFKNS